MYCCVFNTSICTCIVVRLTNFLNKFLSNSLKHVFSKLLKLSGSEL